MLLELKDAIVEWFRLGFYLSLTQETLKAIQAGGGTEESHQITMLIKWSEMEIPTWEKLITALMDIEQFTIAVNIATKYRKFVQSHTQYNSNNSIITDFTNSISIYIIRMAQTLYPRIILLLLISSKMYSYIYLTPTARSGF